MVERDDPTGVEVRTYYGCVSFLPQARRGSRVQITATRRDFLQTLKDSLVQHIGVPLPDVAQAIRWSDGAVEGALPENARLMQVIEVTQMDCGFCRIELQGDTSRFSGGAIHFRLGLPPAGIAVPQWPRLGSNGATIWPKGEAALHLPVYTARHVDPVAGRLVFDLFQHEGGRATEWAATVASGAEVVVVGPGGGGCDTGGPILGFADDTAFPAIARVLEANPDLEGTITLFPSSDAKHAYPTPTHPGVTLRIADPGRAAEMADVACAALEGDTSAYLWFAGERAQADQVRKAWKQSGRSAKQSYISSYWQHKAVS
jgi:NADPH-dependent ferric siderophore reductase